MPTPSTPRRHWRVWTAILAALGLFAILALSLRGSASLRHLEKAARERERAAHAALLQRLAALAVQDHAHTVSVDLASDFFAGIAAHVVGLTISFDEPRLGPVAVEIDGVQLQFRDGFPQVRADLTLTAQNRTIRAQSLAVLEPQLLPGRVELAVHCLGLAPVGSHLPSWAANVANAEATAAVNRALEKYPLTLPLRDSFEFALPAPEPIDTQIKTPNGKVVVRISLPAGQPIRRRVQPQEVFFTSDGLHLLASLSASSPQNATTSSPARTPENSAGDPLARWRLAPGETVRVRIGREPIISLLGELNSWPDPNRTVRFEGLRAEGHILDKTGGPPFGNGFGAWLEGPERLQGRVVLKQLAPTWDAAQQRITLPLTATAEGSVQLHFHGNAPHIPPPKIFGLKLGGGVTVGGGAGTSIGARVPRQEFTVTTAATLHQDAQSLELSLLDPPDLSFKLDIGGVPDELERLFKLGFKVPLPRDRPLYKVALPPIIADRVVIPMPKQAGGGTKTVALKAALKSRFENDQIQVTGTLDVAPP